MSILFELELTLRQDGPTTLICPKPTIEFILDDRICAQPITQGWSHSLQIRHPSQPPHKLASERRDGATVGALQRKSVSTLALSIFSIQSHGAWSNLGFSARYSLSIEHPMVSGRPIRNSTARLTISSCVSRRLDFELPTTSRPTTWSVV